MTEAALIHRLDASIDTLLAGGDATAALRDPELAPLVRVASELRHYPRPEFRLHLRARLERRTAMAAALVATHVREGFTTITPYVRVRDASVVSFLRDVFGAVETRSETGSAGGMHREVRVGNSMLMIGEGGSEGLVPVRPVAFHVYVEDVDATFARALAAGATSLGAPEDRPYGERAGFVRDPAGNHWYIATHLGGSYVPEGLRVVTPFLHARAAAAYIDFLERAFGAAEERRVDTAGHVRYARIRIGSAAIELGEADEVEPMPCAFYMYVDDPDLVYEQALAAGAKPLWPPADQRYGERMGAVEDPAGTQWFIARPAGR